MYVTVNFCIIALFQTDLKLSKVTKEILISGNITNQETEESKTRKFWIKLYFVKAIQKTVFDETTPLKLSLLQKTIQNKATPLNHQARPATQQQTLFNASWRHQQSFHDVQWFWCAVHVLGDPSNASDHGGFCLTLE